MALTILLTLIALSAAFPARSTDPAPVRDCIPTLMSLGMCGAYVMAGSTAAEPDRTCCDALETILTGDNKSGTKSGETCLCDAFNNRGGLGAGIQLNVTKASSLPDDCGINFPPVAGCNFGHATPPVPAPKTRSPLNIPPSAVKNNPSSSSSSLATSVMLLLSTTLFFMYKLEHL